jgi:hypothetical protein
VDKQSTVTHTPGPWELPVMEGLTDRGDNYRYLIAGKGYYESETGGGFCLSGFMSDSDANLIVAAPDLLDALKLLKLECLADVLNPCWDNRSTDKPGLHWGSEPDAPVKACSSCIARAAIAKAEGRA